MTAISSGTLNFSVPEMDCNHCVHSITEAIHRVDPAAKVEADLSSRVVRVGGTADAKTYSAAMEEAGFDATQSA